MSETTETIEVVETIDRIRNKARDLAKIFRAIYEGKTVQYLPQGDSTVWTDWTYPRKLPETEWLYGMQWRIKPEPKTWWLRMQNGRVISVQEFEPSEMFPDAHFIKVREVLP
jgi:hypothetical protein